MAQQENTKHTARYDAIFQLWEIRTWYGSSVAYRMTKSLVRQWAKDNSVQVEFE